MRGKKFLVGVGAVLIIIGIVLIKKRLLFNDYFIKEKVQYLSKYLSTNYLYDFDEEKGLEAIYSGYVSGTENSVTYYLDAYDYQQAVADDAGDYYGCGMVMMWNMDGQSFLINKVIKNSPADKEGVCAGDKITKINDIPVILSNSSQLIEAAFNTEPKEIHFMITHDGEEKEVSMQPEKVTLDAIEAQMIEDILYIHFNSIKNGTSDEINRLLNDTEYAKAKGVILDVRDLYTNNIDEVSKICDLFKNKGELFKVTGKKEKMKEYVASNDATDKKLCLIVNTSTRAGGEALVLGLMDEGKVIGSETGGLKYLRTLVALEDGSGISIASGIICDKYGNEISAESVRLDERVFISEEEKIEILETGTIKKEHDSYIKAALKNF